MLSSVYNYLRREANPMISFDGEINELFASFVPLVPIVTKKCVSPIITPLDSHIVLYLFAAPCSIICCRWNDYHVQLYLVFFPLLLNRIWHIVIALTLCSFVLLYLYLSQEIPKSLASSIRSGWGLMSAVLHVVQNRSVVMLMRIYFVTGRDHVASRFLRDG